MEKIRAFHDLTIGESHIKKNIPCQDASGSFEEHEKDIYIGVVSDGHGSKDYIRSDIGSKILVDVAMSSIKEFIVQSEYKNLFESKFTSRNTITSGESPKSDDAEDSQNSKNSNDALNQLFKSIIASWQQAIVDDWQKSVLSKEEMIEYGTSENMVEQYLKGENLPIAYGCTLLAFARTKDYWFTFQIGDGKSIGFDKDMNAIEPIPADVNCIGNLTTSMCEDNAFENFRYAYGTNIPAVLFIGSDGLDGYFSKMEEHAIEPLKSLYRSVVDSFLNKGFDEGLKDLNNSLPVFSKRGVTQDDMSLAGWIDYSKKDDLLKGLIHFQKIEAEQKIQEVEQKLQLEQEELNGYEDSLVSKTNEILSLDEKLITLKIGYEQSQGAVQEYQKYIVAEEEKQVALKNQRDITLAQKQKLEAELNNITKVKENKSLSIQNMLEEKEKTKSLIEEITDRISKFFGGN